MTDPFIKALEERQRRMERELEGLRRLVEGDESIGYTGLRIRVEMLSHDCEETRRMLEGLQESETRREKREEALVQAERERKKERRNFYFLLAGSIATGVIGIAINFLQTLALS